MKKIKYITLAEVDALAKEIAADCGYAWLAGRDVHTEERALRQAAFVNAAVDRLRKKGYVARPVKS